MAKTLTSELFLKILETYVNPLDNSDTIDRLDYDHNDTMASGTAANQADRLWHDRRTVTAAAEDLDLHTSGTADDAFGDAATFVKVKLLYIRNRSTTASENLAIGAAGSPLDNWVGNAATDIVNIGPSGCMLLYSPIDGYAVVNTTDDEIQVDPGADTIEYDVIVVGTSA